MQGAGGRSNAVFGVTRAMRWARAGRMVRGKGAARSDDRST